MADDAASAASAAPVEPDPADVQQDSFKTLKYSLLGPSLTKAGQDSVDQSKVSEIIYNASKGSKFFNREEERDKLLTQKIDDILAKKRRLEKLDLTRESRAADTLIAELELSSRDLTQRIVHVDCDAFYAAVEELDRPEIKDVPFAVGAGVLTTCNYHARKFGCRSGMAGFVAKKLCPEILMIRPNFEKYMAKAHEVRDVLVDYDPRFESASCDEAYLNITEYCAEHNMTAEEAVQQMRDEIHEKTKITVSAGIAANAKLAKICSNINKPNGQYSLPNDRFAVMSFMRDLPTRKVNGIGRVLERQLKEIGVQTCGEIYPQRHLLRHLFGEKTYDFLIRIHLGLGRTSIQPAEDYERKSIGTESTFRDMSDPNQLREKLRWTAEELEKDMLRAEVKGRTLVLKVKMHTYEVFTRQVVVPRAICKAGDLFEYSLPILTKLLHEVPNFKLRLMGLRCTHLSSTKKPDARAFFGLQPLPKGGAEEGEGTAEEGSSGKRKAGSERPDAEDNEGLPIDDENTIGYHDNDDYERTMTPTKDEPEAAMKEEWWDCPICARPQPADERRFNEHLDLCLSRQTIRDTVHEDSPPLPGEPRTITPPVSSSSRSSNPKKKRIKTSGGRPASADDPRQKRLFFG